MYIFKARAVTHMLIILAAKLTGVLLFNSFLSQFHNGCNSNGKNCIVIHLSDERRYSIQNELLKYDWNANISKESNLKYLPDIMANGDTLAENDLVTKQYENLPYPAVPKIQLLREEEWYKKDKEGPFVIAKSNTLPKSNHYLHKGNENFQDSFRMIIAGGGTGAVTAFSAEQLNHTNGEVVYIDFSMSSMKISQERTRIRSLQNIIWIQSWIEALIYLGIGSFDELQCSGVLHHLKNPSIGLKILKYTLSNNGGMTLMVYAKYGRTAVYHIQHLMKMINADQHEIETEIKRAKITIDALPGHNWFIANQLMSDHFQGNIGIYDLFLHKRDIAFGFQTLFQWIQKGGLHFIDFDSTKKRLNLKIKYQPFDYILKTKTSMLAETKQLSITELLHGRIIKHDFYASKIKSCVADLHQPSNVLYLYGNPFGFRQALANGRNMVVLKNQTVFFATMAEIYRLQTSFNFNDDLGTNYPSSEPITLSFKWNNFSEFLVHRLVDSNRGVNLKSLYQDYRWTINSNISDNELVSLTEDFYDSVKDTEMFLLKKQYVNRFPKTAFTILFVIK